MRALGLDIGARRFGVAVSDATGTLARPLRTVAWAESGRDLVACVLDVVEELAREDEPVGLIVVGWPKRLDGSANEQTPQVERFVERLRGKCAVPVVLQDERLTSIEAESRLALRHRDWRDRKKKLDAAAAAVILQDYLDERPRPAAGDSSVEPETEE